MEKSDLMENPFEKPIVTSSQEEATESAEVETKESKETQEAKPVYLGDKKFNSVDELIKYTNELEKVAKAVSSPEPAQKAKKPSELLYEDPDKAFEAYGQEIIQKIKSEEAAKKAEQDLWDSFYSKNKDLSEDKDLVDFALTKNWNELKSLHPDLAMEKLAEYTRKAIVRFRKTSGQKQELPSGQAKAGPGTSYSAPQIKEKRDAPIDFVTQLKKIQSKRK